MHVAGNTDSFYFMPCIESDQLLIVFSGAGSKRRFTGFKLLKDYPINRLFILDKTRSWYQNPVAGQWQNIDGMVERIRTVADRFKPNNIICMGGSMGGYAAMVTAAKLRAGRALLFSPQTVLDHRLPNNPPAHIKPRYADAFSLLVQSPDTQVKIYVGTEDEADLYNVSPAQRYRGFDIEFIYGAPHNLMVFLFQRNMLLELISSYLENRQPRILYPEFNLLDRRDLYRNICDFVRGLYFDESDYQSLNSLLDTLPPGWPAVYHWRGKLHAKFGDHIKAVEQFEQAVALNDKDDDAIFKNLGLSAIQTREYKKAEQAFRKADEISQTPSPMYLSKLGATLMLQKHYDEAIAMQHQALEANPTHAPAYYQLGLVMNITGRYEEAVPMFERAITLGDQNPKLQKHFKTAKTKSTTTT